MGSPQPRANDLGIIYSKNGPGTGSYVDVAGVTQANGTITASYTEQTTVPLGLVDYSHPYVGARDALSLAVDVTLGSASGIKLKLQGRYDAAAAWADIQTVREDTGNVAAEQTFTTGTFQVQTSSVLGVPQIRLVAQAVGGGFTSDDSIRVRGWVQ